MARTPCVFIMKAISCRRQPGEAVIWRSFDSRLLYIRGEQATNSWQIQVARQLWLRRDYSIPKSFRCKKKTKRAIKPGESSS